MRYAVAADEPLLQAFRCSRGIPFEDEIESFVRRDAAAWFFSDQRKELEPRLILALGPSDELLGVAGHEARDIKLDGVEALGTLVLLVAQALMTRGRRLKGGERLSDLLMRVAVSDAWRLRKTACFVARAHVDNVAGLALCERMGLHSQTAAVGSKYVWITGSLEPPEGLKKWLPEVNP